MRTVKCPECESTIIRSIEQGFASYGISGIDEHGWLEYDGAGAEVDYDSFSPLTEGNKVLLACQDCSHEWYEALK